MTLFVCFEFMLLICPILQPQIWVLTANLFHYFNIRPRRRFEDSCKWMLSPSSTRRLLCLAKINRMMKQDPISFRADNALAGRCQSFAACWARVYDRPSFSLAAYIDNNLCLHHDKLQSLKFLYIISLIRPTCIKTPPIYGNSSHPCKIARSHEIRGLLT